MQINNYRHETQKLEHSEHGRPRQRRAPILELAIMAVLASVLTFGCSNMLTDLTHDSGDTTAPGEDTTAPTPGDSGSISISNVTATSAELSWTKAEDNDSAQADLQYKVVYSTSDNIDTVSDAQDNGTVAEDWTTDMGTASATALNSGTKYYFNVLVKDEAGNTAAYTSTSQTTKAWNTVGSAGFSAGEADDNDIAISSTGVPYVAFGDKSDPDNKNNPVTVMRYTGGTWEYVGGSPGISHEAGETGGAGDIRIALDGSDTPYVVYRDFNNSPSGATVMKYTGSSSETDETHGDGWEYLGLTQDNSSTHISAGGSTQLDIAIDSNDTPYVVYKDYSINSGNGAVTVLRYTGNSSESDAVASDGWEYVDLGSTPRISQGNAREPNIVLDSNDTPYVSFEDAENSYGATVMKYTGSSGESDAVAGDGWEYVGTSANIAEDFQDLHIALDSDDTPYVSFADSNNNMKTTVMHYTGNTSESDRVAGDGWEYLGSPAFSAGSPGYPYFTGILIDSNNTPYVVYQATGELAAVSRYDGASWNTVGAEVSTGVAEDFRLTVDGSDVPYVVYQDGDSGPVTVKKFD